MPRGALGYIGGVLRVSEGVLKVFEGVLRTKVILSVPKSVLGVKGFYMVSEGA